MIFKTFDSKIDKWTSKIGIFGKSFNELGTAVNDAFKSVIDNLDNFDENVGFWESLKNNLFSKKTDKDWIKNSFGDIISKENINSYIKELDLESAKEKLQGIFDWQEDVKNNDKTWQDYFETCKGGNEYLIDLIKNTDDLSKLTGEDLVKANQQARQSALDHNEAIKAQTFSAKAGKAALQALAMAGNMLAMWFISKGIELAATSLDKFINATKHAAENAQALSSTMNNSISSISGNVSKLSDLNNEYQELSRGVNKLGENVSLSSDDYSRYKDIISQISDIMPNLTTYFNAQGEKIAFAKGQLSDLNQEYNKYIQNQAVKYVSEGDGEGHKIQDILDNYNYNQYDDLNGFQKFWSGLKISLGFVNENDFTASEIMNELEELRTKDNIQEIYEYLKSYSKTITGKPDLIERDSAIKYMLLNELGLSGKDTKEILDMTEADYNAIMQSIIAYIDDYNTKITSDMNGVRTSLLMQAYSKNDYWEQNEDVQNDIISFLSAIDSNVWETLNIKTEHDVSKFVNNIIDSMSNNTGEFADAWNNLFNPELTNLSVDEYVQQINNSLKTICNALGLDEENGIQILKVSLGFDNVDDSYKKLQNSFRKITDDHGSTNREEYNYLIENTKELTFEQIDLWLESTNGAQNVTQAIQMYKDELKKLSTTSDSSISQTIDLFNTRLTPALNSLKSAYQNIFTADGFDLNAVDTSMLADIKSDIETLNQLEGVHINIDTKAFDDFVTVLTDSTTTEQQAKQAFNDLASTIFYASDATDGMTDETRKLVEQLLASLGVTNASAVAEYALQKSKAQAVLTTYDLAGATEAEFLAILGEGEAAGLTRQAIYNLTAAEIAFGNNNLNAPKKIEQLKELATAYGDTASSALATAIANDLASGHTDVDSAISDLMSQINSGMKKVNLDLNEQLTGLFLSLTRNYDENGNAILGLSGSVDSVTESIKALVEQEKDLAKAKIRKNIEQYFDGTDDADGAWKALEGRKNA